MNYDAIGPEINHMLLLRVILKTKPNEIGGIRTESGDNGDD